VDSWIVYILRCGDGTLYTGITNDLERRIAAHQRGTASRYTRSRLPVDLACHEPANSRGEALKREAAIKRLTREQKLELIKGCRA
jgi:putative endonuclease